MRKMVVFLFGQHENRGSHRLPGSKAHYEIMRFSHSRRERRAIMNSRRKETNAEIAATT